LTKLQGGVVESFDMFHCLNHTQLSKLFEFHSVVTLCQKICLQNDCPKHVVENSKKNNKLYFSKHNYYFMKFQIRIYNTTSKNKKIFFTFLLI